MQINQSVWDQYPTDDSRFLDPLYEPYVKVTRCCKNPKVCESQECRVFPFKKQGCDDMVNEHLVRKGWGLDFQMLQPQVNLCPEGWTKDRMTGWCTTNEPEFEGTLYTDQAFVPYYQYWNGYTADSRSNIRESEFDIRSVNPYTGNYVNYFTSHPYTDYGRYGRLPSKDSLLA